MSGMTEKKEETGGLYARLLKAGKEAIEAAKIPFEVRKSEKDLEKEIIEIEQKISEQDLAIQTAKGARPLDLPTILNAIDKKALLERSLKQASELQKELF